MKLLCLSNGHGEDAIALRVIQELQQSQDLEEIFALPLVGEGHAYEQAGIPMLGTVKAMPSGGFVYMDGRQLARDLQGGLLSLTLTQIRTIRDWATTGGRILAVGDIVPLLFAWMSGASYGFIGTAKSEYYLRDETGLLARRTWFERMESWSGSVYLPWERWLMGHPRCRAVFPRDTLTATILKRWPLPVFDLGNPMMDDLKTEAVAPSWDLGELTLVLLPGSRNPEVYANWSVMLQGVQALIATQPQPLHLVGAIAPSLSLDPLVPSLRQNGWQPAGQHFIQGPHTLRLSQTAFAQTLQQAHLAIAMAGTATEQAVGMGKPVITFPGQGPQFTPAFAEAQTRLLGRSILYCTDPQQTPEAVSQLIQHPELRHQIAANGQRRMGPPGAAARIATGLLNAFAKLESV